jgi:putative thioredoxin
VSNSEVFIFEVSKQNFDYAVIQNSHKLPVLVEFMGVWSGPCFQMSDELSILAKEFAGQFIFAKVDIDEQPELKEQYAIENVPSLKVFKNGEVVKSEEGLLKQNELRDVLKEFGVYSQADEMRLEAREKHMKGDTVAAIQLLTQAIQQDPSNTKIAMDMAQIFIDLNELDQANSLFNQLPDSAKKTDMGKSLIGQLTFLDLAAKTPGKFQLQQSLLTNPNNCDVHFDLAVCLIADRDYEQAVDHLFEIMRIDSNYKDNAAREMIVNVTNMLAPNNPELSSKIRSRLSSFSFS